MPSGGGKCAGSLDRRCGRRHPWSMQRGSHQHPGTAAFLADLPAAAVKYVRRVEELIRCPVALLSTSPERDDTILVTDPFAD